MAITVVGKDLLNDYTQQVVRLFGVEDVDQKEMNKSELVQYVTSKKFNTIYLANDYQEYILPYLDSIDAKAKMIGCVDTIVCQDGKTVGYNNNYIGLMDYIRMQAIRKKRIMILGSKNISKTFVQVCKDKGASEIVVVDVESGKDYIDAYAAHMDVDVLIQTSDIGKGTNGDETPIDISLFSNLRLVIETICDPIRTQLILDAKEKGIPALKGFNVLCNEIKTLVESNTGSIISLTTLRKAIREITFSQINIVLIGMPSAGKTSIGKNLSRRVKKEFIDMDAVIVEKTGMAIPDIFAKSKEAGFRKIESLVSHDMGLKHGIIIGTGGGTIKKEYNMNNLKRNGIVVFIDRDLENLVSYDPNRPLSSSKEAVAKLYEERYPLYNKYADIVVPNNDAFKKTVYQIIHAYKTEVSKNIK